MKINAKEAPMPEFKVKLKTWKDFSQNAELGYKNGNTAALPYEYCEGYDLSVGKLTPFTGLKRVKWGDGGELIVAMHLRKNSNDMIVCTDQNCYRAVYFPEVGFRAPYRIFTGSLSCSRFASMCVEGKEVTVMTTNGQGTFCYNGVNLSAVQYNGNAFYAKTVCYAYDRFFFTDGHSVFYTAALQPETVVGKIDFEPNEGLILDMVAMDKKIYLLREGCITLLQVNSAEEDLIAEPIRGAFTDYIENTAVAVGKVLMFACKDGVYAFDGNKIFRMDVPSARVDLSDIAVARAGRWSRYYVLSIVGNSGTTKTLFVDATTGNAVLENFSVRAWGEELFSVNGYMVLFDYKNGELTKKNWRSILSDFGLGVTEKTLKKLVVFGHGTVLLTVTNENGVEKSVEMTLYGRTEKVIALRGKAFQFTISGEAEVSGLSATFFIKE